MSGDLNSWIGTLLGDPDLTRMGHAQGGADNNLGLGWLYYALARILRPATVVVIGSYRGFVPMVLGRALADNGEGGQVHFLDPSMVDDFWKDGTRVEAYFASHGLRNIRHHLATTQQFVAAPAFGELQSIGILLIDGYHTEEQARFDYEAFQGRLSPGAIVLFHDSIRERSSRIYGADRAYVHTVKRFVDALKRDPGLQVRDLLERHGLYDACIIGGGDTALASAAFGAWDHAMEFHCLNQRQRDRYFAWAEAFHREVRGSVSCLDGDLFHLWHGTIADRRSRQRHQGLAGFAFDPGKDVAIADSGCWQWARDKPELHAYVRDYFYSRNEDGEDRLGETAASGTGDVDPGPWGGCWPNACSSQA